MTLIEGVGDEVIQFVGVLLVATVAMLAWLSTNARPGRYRTVVIMRPRQHHPVTVSIQTRANFMIAGNETNNSQEVATPETVVSPPEAVEEPRDTSHVIPLQEMDSIIDADMAMMNNNRLHFYRRLDAPGSVQGFSDSASDESETQEESEPASNEQIREMDSIVNAMEADVTAGCDFFTRPNESNPTLTESVKSNLNEGNVASTASNVPKETDSNVNSESQSNGDESTSIEMDRRKILIKLKYLNDSLKEVEGSLDEQLKDFKWRHFSSELTSECRVRLIFNGRALADESATLRACGLHDRAVVHCLVHPKRATAQRAEEDSAGLGAAPAPAAAGGPPAPERAWDLENILMTLVSVALTVVWFFRANIHTRINKKITTLEEDSFWGSARVILMTLVSVALAVVWFFRCEYSNMFTASASVALFGLTIFYSVAIFGLYLSDTFHFDRRPTQAQPIPEN